MTPFQRRFFGGWAAGVVAIFLADATDGRSMAAMLVGGPAIVLAAAALWSDAGGSWTQFMRGQRGGRVLRGFAATLCAVVGLGWTLGGVLGLLRIFGAYEFPD